MVPSSGNTTPLKAEPSLYPNETNRFNVSGFMPSSVGSYTKFTPLGSLERVSTINFFASAASTGVAGALAVRNARPASSAPSLKSCSVFFRSSPVILRRNPSCRAADAAWLSAEPVVMVLSFGSLRVACVVRLDLISCVLLDAASRKAFVSFSNWLRNSGVARPNSIAFLFSSVSTVLINDTSSGELSPYFLRTASRRFWAFCAIS